MITIKNSQIKRNKLVSLAEAKSHLRIVHNREDLYIDNLITIATTEVENYIDFVISTYEAEVEVLTEDYEPQYLFNQKVEIKNVKGFDIDGEEVIGEYDIEQDANKKLIINSIPEGVVLLTFDISTQSPFVTIPETFKQATLIIIGDLFSNRQDHIVGKSSVSLRLVERLLNPYKNIVFV
jgi:hypothetical protein